MVQSMAYQNSIEAYSYFKGGLTNRLCDQAKHRAEINTHSNHAFTKLALSQRVTAFIKGVFLSFVFLSLRCRVASGEAFKQAFTGECSAFSQVILFENIKKIENVHTRQQALYMFSISSEMKNSLLASEAQFESIKLYSDATHRRRCFYRLANAIEYAHPLLAGVVTFEAVKLIPDERQRYKKFNEITSKVKLSNPDLAKRSEEEAKSIKREFDSKAKIQIELRLKEIRAMPWGRERAEAAADLIQNIDKEDHPDLYEQIPYVAYGFGFDSNLTKIYQSRILWGMANNCNKFLEDFTRSTASFNPFNFVFDQSAVRPMPSPVIGMYNIR